MRTQKKQGALRGRGVTGTHVVMLGLDLVDPGDAKDLLGFAIEREDPTERERYWLQGMRTFEATLPSPTPGQLVSTREHPIQDFLWSDFTAKPGRRYVYRVHPVRGTPKRLELGKPLELSVETEVEMSKAAGSHSVFFNRGVIGSQAYAQKFGLPPDRLPPERRAEALAWLSRGLEEALFGFLAEATGKGFGLRVAAYELSHAGTAAALGEAKRRGVDVKIVYDGRVPAKGGDDEARRVATAEQLLGDHGLSRVATPRRSDPQHISHNKFIVLLEGKTPVAVWTGSTNFTDSGIYGQANVGHVVRDPEVAAAYLAYWERLQRDPSVADLRKTNATATPNLEGAAPTGTTPLFSPRGGLAQLSWYAGALGAATEASFFTAAFGINKLFLKGFAEDERFLRYVFLEKWGVTREAAALAEELLSRDVDIQVAVGAYLPGDALDGWVAEVANSLSRNVKYVHTKFMLVDPLGDDPLVVTGSANFSDASTSGNDENMLVIRGDTRVADIYLGEFMRLWRHHNFRDIVLRRDPASGVERHNHLEPTGAWTKRYFAKDTVQAKRRALFGFR